MTRAYKIGRIRAAAYAERHHGEVSDIPPNSDGFVQEMYDTYVRTPIFPYLEDEETLEEALRHVQEECLTDLQINELEKYDRYRRIDVYRAVEDFNAGWSDEAAHLHEELWSTFLNLESL